MSILDWFSSIMFNTTKGSGTPADHRTPHDARDDETVDEATGIGMEDGQELDNTEIDPEIQDREKGFPDGTK